MSNNDTMFKSSFVQPDEAIRTAYSAISSLQVARPEYQVVGIAVLFQILSDGLGMPPNELLSKASRVIADGDTFFRREVKALRDYVKGELI